MNEDRTFWECIHDARSGGQIPRVWRTRELIDVLTPPAGRFSPNTVSVLPYNGSISREGNGIGDFIKRGIEPKAWRVGRGKFELIVDPDDDAEQQNAQREMAKMRAAELRAQVRRTAGQINPARPTRPRILTRSETPGRSEKQASTNGRDVAETITLDDLELQEIAELSTEHKALYIVEKYIRDKYGNDVEIEEDHDGADLRLSVHGQDEQRIEVKGTASRDLAWSQLKVSSQNSHDALESGEATMYRVVNVDGPQPSIYILKYDQDFTLEPEPRWAVRQIRREDDRYPLRGRPYRYNLPLEPVAQDDWETPE